MYQEIGTDMESLEYSNFMEEKNDVNILQNFANTLHIGLNVLYIFTISMFLSLYHQCKIIQLH